MVFGAVDNISLGFGEMGWEEDVGPKFLEQLVELGRGSGLEGRKGP